MGPKYMKEIDDFRFFRAKKIPYPIYEALVDQGLGNKPGNLFNDPRKFTILDHQHPEKVLYPKI
jgi:hypothetical protein